VVIDGQEFDLDQGSLFLVSVKDRPTRVDQVVIDTEQLQGELIPDQLPDRAKADPRVAAFLQSCKVSE
jgi:hypothetical protein